MHVWHNIKGFFFPEQHVTWTTGLTQILLCGVMSCVHDMCVSLPNKKMLRLGNSSRPRHVYRSESKKLSEESLSEAHYYCKRSSTDLIQ